MGKKTIAVVGATGSQGGGVVSALKSEGSFSVRAVTRNPDRYEGNADEAVAGDLTDVDSLTNAFKGAHGVFVVTNFWEGADELEQGKTAIQAAKNADIDHFIWSTLPNVEQITGGKLEVPHFTGKAKVDELVKKAGFTHFTFVQAPFYFQNLAGQLAAQEQQDGSLGWTLPIDPQKKAIHMGDISDLGKVVAGAFLNPEKTGKGSYLSFATGSYSFNDVIAAFEANGKQYSFNYVPVDVFSKFPFQGADEIAQMFAYFESHTYMGPDAEQKIELARNVATADYNSLHNWIKQNID